MPLAGNNPQRTVNYVIHQPVSVVYMPAPSLAEFKHAICQQLMQKALSQKRGL